MDFTDTLYFDVETFNVESIGKGSYAYAETVQITIAQWALNGGAVHVIDCTDLDHDRTEVMAHLENPRVRLVAHGSSFDRTQLCWAWGVAPAIERWHDTMVQAFSHGLPGGLGVLSNIFKLGDKSKDKEGKALLLLFCKPQAFRYPHRYVAPDEALFAVPDESLFETPKEFKQAKSAARAAYAEAKREARSAYAAAKEAAAASWTGRATRDTHPVEWAKFLSYAGQDIIAMRELHKRIPMWNYKGAELALWHLDQKMNDRGVCIDMDLVHSAMSAVDKAQIELAARTVEMTEGELESTTQRDKTLAYLLEAHGVHLPDMQMATIERTLEDPDLPAALRELLAIRLQASTSSTSKYKALLKGVSSDGRLRGTLQFNGAIRTGRWAGRLFQPQNLPRPTLKEHQIAAGVAALKAGCADLVVDNVMQLTSSAIRNCMVASPGKKLVVADLSNIEGRVQAWLCDESWKLKAFRAFDAGTGHDLYKLAYAKTFGIRPEDVDKHQRQIGKVMELALGYAGGVPAFLNFATLYKIDLDALGKLVLSLAPPWALEAAKKSHAWHVKKGGKCVGLSDDTYIACETLKHGWRAAHSNISSFWGQLEQAAKYAISHPGERVECGKLVLRVDGVWLRIALPSGRALCYPRPSLDEKDGSIRFEGVHRYTHKWDRLHTYGGKLFENCCQAIARDVMTATMPTIEAEGYELLLTIHDEILCETPDTPDYSSDRLAEMMSAPPSWAPAMPLAAAGFESYFYKKVD